MSTTTTTTATPPVTIGDAVPEVTFQTRTRIESTDDNPFDWLAMSSSDYFKDKRVVLFSLPGAFTPTCSTTHLPGYEAAYEEMKGLGVDEVYCLSVNDAFVMVCSINVIITFTTNNYPSHNSDIHELINILSPHAE